MPDPCAYDSESDFHADCMAERRQEHPAESTEQSNAVCYSMWRERECSKTMRKSPVGPVFKAAEVVTISEDEAIFLASSEKVDRIGDIVRQNWDLTDFHRNPILAYGHATDASAFPIGKVQKFWTEDTKSFARALRLPEGMDATADKVWRMVKEGFLNAVSVGFNPTEPPKARFDKDDRFLGYEFPRNELLELSVVMVPAHPDALAVQRAYKLSDEDMGRIFRPPSVSANVAHARRFIEIERLRASN